MGRKKEGEEIINTVFVLYSCMKFSENKLNKGIGNIDGIDAHRVIEM